MPGDVDRSIGFGGGLSLVVLGIAVCLGVYWFTLSYGFDYDDYHLLRPYTRHEVARSFVGSWDPSGVEAKFYRPLTTAFYAARFWLFGVDARAYHALGLVLFGVAAGVFGWFVAEVSGRGSGGVLGTLVYALHPAMTRSQAIWATNQMHLLMSLIVGGAFLWWALRARKGGAWWPIVLASVLALLVKEDGVMLLPALLVVHAAYHGLVDRQAPWPPWPPLLIAVVVIGAILALRHYALGGVGGYGGVIRIDRLWSNYLSGFRLGFLVYRPDGSSLGKWTQWFVAITLLGGGLAVLWRRQARPGLLLFGAVAAAVCFNAPFVLVSKAEQLHLVASFSAVAVTAAFIALWQVRVTRPWRAGVCALTLVGLTLFGLTARLRAELYRPLSPWVLGHDDAVQGWPGLPAEVWDWLDEKQRTGQIPAVGPVSNLPVIVFGGYGWEPGAGVARMRWAGERLVLLPRTDVESLEIPLASLTPLQGTRFRAVVTTADGASRDVELDGDPWTIVRVPVASHGWFAFQRAVTIVIRPTWLPADVYPGNADARRLSVRVGEVRAITRTP
jgi:hypothetical protein